MKNSERFELQEKKRKAIEFDRLKMYFGETFAVNDKIKIIQPYFGQILDIGEQTFYGTLSIFISNSTGYRLPLWNIGQDWNKIIDYELFQILYKGVDQDIVNLLFDKVPLLDEQKNPVVGDDGQPVMEDLNFGLFDIYKKTTPSENEEEEPIESIVLYNPVQDIEIDEDTYLRISQYLRTSFNIFPKTERAKGRATKEAIIWEEEQEANKRKGEPYRSTLLPVISSLVNHPGFKYKLSEIRDLTMVQIMDSVQRLQVYENTTALLRGSMSGFVDTSKIPKDNFNFMRDIASTDD